MTGQPKYQNIYVKADNYAPPKNFQGKESVQSVAGRHLGDNQGTGESATCSGTSVHFQALCFLVGSPLSWDVCVPVHLPPHRLSTFLPCTCQALALPRSGGPEPAFIPQTVRQAFLRLVFFNIQH